LAANSRMAQRTGHLEPSMPLDDCTWHCGEAGKALVTRKRVVGKRKCDVHYI